MSSGLLLDTRAPLLSMGPHFQRPAHPSQTSSPSFVFFRNEVQRLVRSTHQDRAALRKGVIDRIKSSRDPMGYIGELLDQCVGDDRSEGMDIAIDVLTHFGGQVYEYAREFLRKDAQRWDTRPSYPRHHIHDDIWYILLRAVGGSHLGMLQKVALLRQCAAGGPPVVREASVRTLGDIGGEVAARLVRGVAETDTSPMVREAAAEVLDDLEG